MWNCRAVPHHVFYTTLSTNHDCSVLSLLQFSYEQGFAYKDLCLSKTETEYNELFLSKARTPDLGKNVTLTWRFKPLKPCTALSQLLCHWKVLFVIWDPLQKVCLQYTIKKSLLALDWNLVKRAIWTIVELKCQFVRQWLISQTPREIWNKRFQIWVWDFQGGSAKQL